jgi:prepilin-type N-terminal cleavage/methylation domain-containing protein
MSKTGNKKQGFTLIEVMVATAVLAFSLVLIYQAFFISLDSFNYCSNFLNVVSWADEKIWQSQDSISRLGSIAGQTEGSFESESRKFDWSLDDDITGQNTTLHKINLVLSWKEGKRDVRLSRTAYAIYEKQ